ncbi:MAG: hypothetical protein R3C15_20585 [Thermoleophilia bacterium]
MSRDELTPFSYVVMALIGRDGAGPHDIKRMAQRGRTYWVAGESQYYTEPKRLARLGYLEATKQTGRTRERTHYTLTPRGLDALRDWAWRPSSFPRMQQEGAVRLIVADLVGEAPVRASIAAMRTEIADIAAMLDVAEEAASTLPHRERYLRLNHRLSRRLLDAYAGWIDEVERELSADR